MLLESSEVQLRAIAFMLAKFVTRIALIQLYHDAIPRDLGDDTRRRDAETQRVALHQGRVRNWKWAHRQSIDQGVIRSRRESHDCAAHRLVRGAQDIDAVNLIYLNNTNRPRYINPSRELGIDLLAHFRGCLLYTSPSPRD